MVRHKKYDLLNYIVQSIIDSGWNVLFIEDIKHHPFVLKIYNNDENYLLRIYVWNITHGGGAARSSDEYRIQITPNKTFEQNKGETTLILGWWEEAGVFAGFDYNRHKSKLGSSPSIQIREEYLRQAVINGFSPCDKGNNEIAIAFRPDFIISYIQNLEQLHNFSTSKRDFQVLEQVANNTLIVNAQALNNLTKERQVIITEITKKLRDASFKARVLNAYGNKCAFSGIQLKLVDAAHVLPVSAPNSTDETSNGIALSALYHRAYDNGLVTFNEKYQTVVSTTKMKQLQSIGFDGGIDHFIKSIRPIINLPPSVNDRPNINLVQQANKLRGW